MNASAPRRAALVVVIVLIALNLRPFLAAPGPVLPLIASDTGLGYGGLSLLTLLPMLLMGLGAVAAPGFQASLGTRRSLLIALTLLLLGSLLRLAAVNGTVLLLTAVLCGSGAAFAQAVMPGLIKEKFPAQVAVMTGLYSAMIMTGGALGAQLMPYLTGGGLTWRASLAWLSLPVFLAAAATTLILAETRSARPRREAVIRLLQLPRTWLLMGVFGLINGGYASLIAWLAPYYQELGWTSAGSGTLVSVMALSQGCGAVVLPLLARNSPDRRPWLWITIVLQAVGYSGLAFAPLAFSALWVALCGAGLAGSFALCLVVALDHLPDSAQAGSLAALMQGGGFLMAAIPPFVLAEIHRATGSFTLGWTMHLFWVAAAAVLAVRFNPVRYPEVMGHEPAAASSDPRHRAGSV
ncbi:cyanate transporter [Leisingera sp. D0M16]|uniref:cyanate transporter n=1 Tax=Leisingera coralii TaxID=3351347 RepID=UPI003B77D866